MPIFKDGFMPALRNNSDTLLQTGIGLIGGRTANEQATMGLQGFQAGRKENRTAKWLLERDPELAQQVMTGMISGREALSSYNERRTQAEKPATLSFQTLPDGTYGFANPKEGTFNPLGQAQKTGGDQLGLNLTWGRNEDGETVAYQPSKAGGLVPVEVPEGVQLSDPYYRARDAASGKVAGTTQGEAAAQVPGTRVAAEQARGIFGRRIEADVFHCPGHPEGKSIHHIGQATRRIEHSPGLAESERRRCPDNHSRPRVLGRCHDRRVCIRRHSWWPCRGVWCQGSRRYARIRYRDRQRPRC